MDTLEEYEKYLTLKIKETEDIITKHIQTFIDQIGAYLMEKMYNIVRQFLEKSRRQFADTGTMPSIEPLVQQLTLFRQLAMRHLANQIAKHLAEK